eukprot:6438584-Ditylum_brightwellii.AAC.1
MSVNGSYIKFSSERVTCCVSLDYVQYPPAPFPSKTRGGAPASLPSAPHRFSGGIPFSVASFVFKACAYELFVAAGAA